MRLPLVNDHFLLDNRYHGFHYNSVDNLEPFGVLIVEGEVSFIQRSSQTGIYK